MSRNPEDVVELTKYLLEMQASLKALAVFAVETRAQLDAAKVLVANGVGADPEEWRADEQQLLELTRQAAISDLHAKKQQALADPNWGNKSGFWGRGK